jgi:hypothetical protein
MNENEPNGDLLARVRALLTKAERTENEHEREAYNVKAAELMAKYGIDRALLAETDPDSDWLGDRIVPMDGQWVTEKAILLHQVALNMRCRAVKTKRYDRVRVHLFGYESDLDRVDVMFTSLLVQAALELAVVQVPRNENPTVYRRSWWLGFARVVGDRLAQAEAKAQRAATSGPDDNRLALVLVGRDQRVLNEVVEFYPNLRSTTTRVGSSAGWSAGKAAGQRADLGGTNRVRGQRQGAARAVGAQ